MEYKIIFWIVVFVIYLITKSRNKKAPVPPQDSQPYEQPFAPNTSSKPITFEDLLKEIQSSKPSQQPVPNKPATLYEPSRQPKYEDYDDHIEEEEKDLENAGYDYRKEDEIYSTYEKAKQEAFLRPSLEETVKLEDTVVRYDQFKEYKQQQIPSMASIIANDLQNQENIRRAFILSEILNRRY